VPFDRTVLGRTFGPRTFNYDWQRTALYALSVGATTSELDLMLESRGPKVLPSFSVLPVWQPLLDALEALGGNRLTLVHSGQRCVLHRPISPEGSLVTSGQVTHLFDKGKGALAVYALNGKLPDGTLVFETEFQIFYRGEGGFGGDRGPEAPSYEPPAGKPADFRSEMATSETQALLYRLASNDMNPIHSDPEVAKAAGFPKPILHGLCTFGHATRAAVQGLVDGDPHRITSIECRFSRPVLPGDTIATEFWKIGPGEAYFTSTVKERPEPVITLGRVCYR
jgi:acyl dehydratase